MSRSKAVGVALAWLLVAAWPTSAQTTVFFDTFTNPDTSQEDLVVQGNHITDTSGDPAPWAEILDSAMTMSIVAHQNDNARVSGNQTNARILYKMATSPGVGTADYDVSAKFVGVHNNQADDDWACIGGRVIDATHAYLACINAQNAPQVWAIFNLNGSNSGLTAIATGTTTVSVNHILRLALRGSTLKLFGGASGTTQIGCVVDSTHTAPGHGGIGFGNFGTNNMADLNTAWQLDDVSAVTGGTGTDDSCGAPPSTTPRGTLLGVLP